MTRRRHDSNPLVVCAIAVAALLLALAVGFITAPPTTIPHEDPASEPSGGSLAPAAVDVTGKPSAAAGTIPPLQLVKP